MVQRRIRCETLMAQYASHVRVAGAVVARLRHVLLWPSYLCGTLGYAFVVWAPYYAVILACLWYLRSLVGRGCPGAVVGLFTCVCFRAPARAVQGGGAPGLSYASCDFVGVGWRCGPRLGYLASRIPPYEVPFLVFMK